MSSVGHKVKKTNKQRDVAWRVRRNPSAFIRTCGVIRVAGVIRRNRTALYHTPTRCMAVDAVPRVTASYGVLCRDRS